MVILGLSGSLVRKSLLVRSAVVSVAMIQNVVLSTTKHRADA